MPASRLRWTSALASSCPVFQTAPMGPSSWPKVMTPNARRETTSPLFPRRVYCMERCLKTIFPGFDPEPVEEDSKVAETVGSGLLRMPLEEALGFDGRHAARACRRNGLPVPAIDDVAAREHAGNAREHVVQRLQIALLVHSALPLKNLGIGFVPDPEKQRGGREIVGF